MFTLTAVNWNEFLKKNFSQRPFKKYFNLDLSRIVHIDLAEAVGLALASHTARKQNNIVTVRYPIITDGKSQEVVNLWGRVMSFIKKWDIDRIINEAASENRVFYDDFSDKELLQGFSFEKKDASVGEIRLPLTEITGMSSVEWLTDMLQPEFGPVVFGDEYPLSTPVAASGDLATIIVFELTQNIIEHAFEREMDDLTEKERAWTLGIVSFHGRKRLPKPDLKSISDWQRSFFNSLNQNAGFFRVSVGDNGRGIQNTIYDAYIEDDTHKDFAKDEQLNRHILEWAFEDHSSKKQERPSKAFAGLSRVYRVVQKYHGLLSVCSGGVRRVWDFSRNNASPQDYYERIDEHFEGTLFDITFPLFDEKDEKPMLFGTLEKSVSPNELLEFHSKYCLVDSSMSQDTIFNIIGNGSSSAVTENKPLIIDIWDIRGTWKKHSLDYLVTAISNVSIQTQCFVFGVRQPFLKEMRDNDHYKHLENMIVCGIDIHQGPMPSPLQVYWIGLNQQDTCFLDDLYMNSPGEKGSLEIILPIGQVDIARRLSENNPKWFFSRANDDRIMTNLDLFRLIRVSLDALNSRLSYELNKVVDDNYYRTSEGYYTNRFIPIYTLFGQRGIRELVVKGLSLLFNIRFAKGLFITLGTPLKEIIQEEIQGFGCFLHFDSSNDLSLEENKNTIIGASIQDRKAFLVLDVIGSSTTAERVIRIVKEYGIKIEAVFSVIDTRPQCEDIQGVPVYSLVIFPTPKWKELDDDVSGGLKNAYQMGLVPYMDVNTNIFVPSVKIVPLLNTHQVFWEQLYLSKSITHAHKKIDEKGSFHHPYYINPTRPFDLEHAKKLGRSVEASGLLNQLIQSVESQLQKNDKVEVVIYPKHAETEPVIASLQSLFGKIIFIDVDYENHFVIKAGASEVIKGRNVLFFDSGTNTGITLKTIASQIVQMSPKTLNYLIVLNRLSHEEIKEKVQQLRFPKSCVFITAYELGMPSFNSMVCPLCQIEKDYQLLLRNEDGNGYSTSLAHAECKALMKTYDERELSSDVSTFPYWQRIDFWGKAVQANVDEILSLLIDIERNGDSSSDISKQLVIDELARQYNILFLMARINSQFKKTLESSEQLLDKAIKIFREASSKIARYRVAVFLACCSPHYFLKILEERLMPLSSLGRDELADDYFYVIDGIRYIEKENRSRIMRLIHHLEEKQQNSLLVRFIKQDRPLLFEEKLYLSKTALKKRCFWKQYMGNYGPSHTEDADVLLSLADNQMAKGIGSNKDAWTAVLETYNHLSSIRYTSECIIEFLPNSLDNNQEFDIKDLPQIKEYLSPNDSGLFERDIAYICEIVDYRKDIDGAQASELSSIANRLLDLLYRTSGHELGNNAFVGIGRRVVSVEFPSIKEVLQEVIENSSHADSIVCDSMHDYDGIYHSLLSWDELYVILWRIIENAFAHGGTQCFVDCKLDCDPAIIEISDNGRGFLEEQLEYGFEEEKFLAQISSQKSRSRGYDLKLGNSERGAKIVLFFDAMKERMY